MLLTWSSNFRFRWTSLQLQNLTTLKTDADIRERLGKLPPSLEELYMEIYQRIVTNQGAASRAIAHNLFCYILHSPSAIDAEDVVKLVHPNAFGSVQEILDISCNLVVLDSTFHKFRFAHLSVREFLENLPDFNILECHATISACCLSKVKPFIAPILTSGDQEVLGKDGEKLLKTYWSYPSETVFNYTKNWAIFHLKRSRDKGRFEPQYLQRILGFLQVRNLSNFRVPDRGWDHVRSVPDKVSDDFVFMFNACALGFMEIVEEIVTGLDSPPSHIDSNSLRPAHDSPLLKALGIPHLLEVDLGDVSFDHLANHAIQHGNCKTLQMLLDRKLIAVNTEMLLSAASPWKRTCDQSFKESEMMEVLLDAGGIESMTPEVSERVADFAYSPGKTESGTLIIRALQKRKLRISLGERFVRTASETFSWFGEGYENAREEFLEVVYDNHCDIGPGFLEGFVAITALLEPPNLLSTLLERYDSESVTQDIFKQAVFYCHSPEVLGVLIEKSPKLFIDGEILTTASLNYTSPLVLEYLLKQRRLPIGHHMKVTQRLFEILCEHYISPSILAALLDQNRTISITQDLLIYILQKQCGFASSEIQSSDFKISRRILRRVAHTNRSEILTLLLRQDAYQTQKVHRMLNRIHLKTGWKTVVRTLSWSRDTPMGPDTKHALLNFAKHKRREQSIQTAIQEHIFREREQESCWTETDWPKTDSTDSDSLDSDGCW